MYFRFLLTLVAAAAGFLNVVAEDKAEKQIDRMPKIHGVFRGRYEGRWDDYEQRFQVRNARVSLEGRLLKELDYYFRVDLCDRGSMKFLDGWARWRFSPQVAVKAGRFRVPFGVDAFRGPGSYIFTNRSFLGKYMANVRQVGLQLGYYGKSVPLTIEGGVFNSAGGSDQDVWQKGMDYAAKATLRIDHVDISASFLSMNPYGVRMNILDGAATWAANGWLLQAEYQNMHYVRSSLANTQAVLAVAAYTIPVDWRPFNALNIHGRYDYMGNYSTGKPDTDDSTPGIADINPADLLTIDQAERHRATIGATLACNLPYGVKSEIILDYEHYFYNNSAPRATNRIVAELVVKF